MSANNMQRRARRRRRALRLGPSAICMLCGQEELATLIAGKPGLIQQHHVVGQQYDKATTVPLCLNCHAIESLKQIDQGIKLRPPRPFLERLLEILKLLALWFRSLSELMYSLVTSLTEELERMMDVARRTPR